MRIVLREEIILSKKEREAFELVQKVLEGVRREGHHPSLIEIACCALNYFYDFYNYVDHLEED